jgi:hypothetical protein
MPIIAKQDVEAFLNEVRAKASIYDILFLDGRAKNMQALLALEIAPSYRKEIVLTLKIEDYSEGPLDEKMHGLLPMWVFGKSVKGKEVYIKISMGVPNSNAICISFHLAEHPMVYPFKK